MLEYTEGGDAFTATRRSCSTLDWAIASLRIFGFLYSAVIGTGSARD